MLTILSVWIDDNKHTLEDYTDFAKSGKIYTGTEIIAILDHLGIGRDAYSELLVIYIINELYLICMFQYHYE